MQEPNRAPLPSKIPFPWEKGAAVVLCLGAAVLGLWIAFRYGWGILLPFLPAYLLSRIIRPTAQRMAAFTHLPRGLCAAGLILLLAGGGILALLYALRRGWQELTGLAESLVADPSAPLSSWEAAMDRLSSLSSHLPFLSQWEESPVYGELCARLDQWAAEAVTRLGEALTAALPSMAVTLAEWIPSAFVFITVTLLACYYFSADQGGLAALCASLTAKLPPALSDRLPPLARRLGRLGRQYLRAYLTLGLLTFLQAFVGFAVLKIPYAFLLAVLVALVDFLPLLGTGVILLPWAGISLLTGRIPLAIGLAVLYGVTTTVRQILEPKLIGDGLGIHPLLSLAAMYAGLRLFGVWGMILAPLATAGIVSLLAADTS